MMEAEALKSMNDIKNNAEELHGKVAKHFNK